MRKRYRQVLLAIGGVVHLAHASALVLGIGALVPLLALAYQLGHGDAVHA